MAGSKTQDRLRWIELYRNKTGKKEIDMLEVARFALQNGCERPVFKTDEEIVARQLSEAARLQVRHDPETGEAYRANHRIPSDNDGTKSLWLDIDDAPARAKMLLSLSNRRDQTVGDMTQLTRDANRWNRLCPNEEPIQIPLDLTFDVELRLHQDSDEEDEAAS